MALLPKSTLSLPKRRTVSERRTVKAGRRRCFDFFSGTQLLKEQMDDVLDSLTTRERRVLQLRFGLEDGRQRTLEEVGREFGVTRERIRQIEAKALRKLRHPTRSRKLRDYFDH